MQPDIAPPPPIQRLILHGASVRAAAQSARRADFDVLGIDLFADRDACEACERFLKLTPNADVSVRDALDRALAQARRMWPRAMTVQCGDLGGDPRGKDPHRLNRYAKSAGWRIPPTFTPTQNPPARPGRFLVKSTTSSGGMGVRWWNRDIALTDEQLIQTYVSGRSYGATMIANGIDCQLLAVCRSHHTRIGETPFVHAGSSGPVACSQTIATGLTDIGTAFVRDRSHRGLFNVDFIVGEDQAIYLLEINARWSSSMELVDAALHSDESTKTSLMGHHVSVLQSGWMPSVSKRPVEGGYIKRVVYSNRDGKFDQSRFDLLRQRSKDHAAKPHWADIPQRDGLVRSGQPLTTLLTTSANIRELYRATQACVVDEG